MDVIRCALCERSSDKRLAAEETTVNGAQP